MRISVIIPCYNAEKFISHALTSVENQSITPYEIIVVDDSSTDRSVEVIKSSGINVKLFHTQRLGGAGARNAGISAAKGDWLAFLDADDIWYPTHLMRFIDVIGKYDIVGFLNHYDHLDLKRTDLIRRHCPVSSLVIGFGLDEYIDLYVEYGCFVGMSSCMIKRERAIYVGGFNEEQTRRHDIDFWLRVVNKNRWLFDPVATSAYRKNNPGSISSNRASASLYRFVAFMKQKENIYNSTAYDGLLKRLARSALSTSYQFGRAEDREYAYDLAFKYLGKKDKIMYKILNTFPWLFMSFKRAKLI